MSGVSTCFELDKFEISYGGYSFKAVIFGVRKLAGEAKTKVQFDLNLEIYETLFFFLNIFLWHLVNKWNYDVI